MFKDIETQEKYKKPFNVPVYSKYGAPMGRKNIVNKENIKILMESTNFYCSRVDLVEGYDKGGAYWGIDERLYCAYSFLKIHNTPNFYYSQIFTRAKNRNKAKEIIKKIVLDETKLDINFFK